MTLTTSTAHIGRANANSVLCSAWLSCTCKRGPGRMRSHAVLFIAPQWGYLWDAMHNGVACRPRTSLCDLRVRLPLFERAVPGSIAATDFASAVTAGGKAPGRTMPATAPGMAGNGAAFTFRSSLRPGTTREPLHRAKGKRTRTAEGAGRAL